MQYAIQFSSGQVSFSDPAQFEALIPSCSGIAGLSKTDAEKTIVYKIDSPELPDDVRGDWVKIGTYLVNN